MENITIEYNILLKKFILNFLIEIDQITSMEKRGHGYLAKAKHYLKCENKANKK